MNKAVKTLALGVAAALVLGGAAATWHVRSKLPERSGALALSGLSAPVQVRWDEVGVPHLQAQHERDLYRALGYLHAQDRLFQMEMVRRLARGELAEVLGPKLLDTDRLFRTLGLREHATAYVKRQTQGIVPPGPAWEALQAYLDGVNEYQATRPAPLEFDILGIKKRPFTTEDTMAVAGYMAYSFAAAFRTEPALTYVRDQLGPEYLKIFDLQNRPGGAVRRAGESDAAPSVGLQSRDWQHLAQLAQISQQALEQAGLPLYEGSNAWAISGGRSQSGKPLLSGDPHIAFSAPAVWWEAHLKAPGFELYGHHQVLNPMALLGHNHQAGWSLTMFQNDDIDLIAEQTDAAHPDQVFVQGQWQPLQTREETIKVKGAADVVLKLRRSPHGPIINDAIPGARYDKPIAMWWAFLETENPALDAFYRLARADTLAKAREAASMIHAPGLNIVWANAGGDIGWWAAARLPQRPAGVNPSFILDGSKPESDKLGFLPFSANPQEENPARGYIMSANHQPAGDVPGYYNLWDRAQRLDEALRQDGKRWNMAASQQLQLDVQTGYGPRMLKPLLPLLRQAAQGEEDQALVAELAQWQGRHQLDDRAPVLFHQLVYELVREALGDKMDAKLFESLTRTRALDQALPHLFADANSPWWDKRATPQRETEADIVKLAWTAALKHLRATLGQDAGRWRWGDAHTLTHKHPLGQQKPLDQIFNIGPLPAPGANEVPNNLAQRIGPAPWEVVYGPSTRRTIDFAAPGQAQGSNPVGQSGVWGDAHYKDQARAHVEGRFRGQWLDEADVAAHTRSTLLLNPR
ncbi:penicillin acylase family protein [Paucibacter sp. APW11]|uniref:Penicillin acylase family protein n=1 Tax=Roseateles aquae TaxID=3077235 RepID=A0ABU3PIX7_9BURK|nr:penicillin acylase family protein [Paucibacter sp. APW11]MDT9002414.1 penicillin acylase family protein [Paucibacter sp. APW11]